MRIPKVANSLLFAGIILLAILQPSSLWAQSNRISANVVALDKGNFGRIILTFRDRLLLPNYDLTTDVGAQGILVIKFKEPVNAEVRSISQVLSRYIAIARRDPDGRAIRFALNGNFRVNSIEAGEKLFIDLLPANWQGLPPGLPDDVIRDLAKRASSAIKKLREAEKRLESDEITPVLDIRVGRNPTFSRFRFSWNVPFEAQIQRGTKVVSVKFNQIAPFDISSLKANLPPGVEEVEIVEQDKSLKVLLKLDPSADVRAFREGESYFVDVAMAPPEGPQLQAKKQVDTQLENLQTAPESGEDSVQLPGTRPIAAAPQAKPNKANPPAPPMAKQDQSATEKMSADKADQPNKTAMADPPVDGQNANEPKSDSQPTAVRLPAEGRSVVAQSQNLPNPDQMISAQPESKKPTSSDAVFDAPRRRGNPEASDKETSAEPTGSILAEVRRVGDAVRITFPFTAPTSAAVFRRGRTIWMIFDETEPIDISVISRILQPDAKKIEMTSGSGHQILRMEMRREILASTALNAHKWIVTLGDLILEPSQPVSISRLARADGTLMLAASITKASNIYKIQDPAVGDQLLVATIFGPSRGLAKTRSFSQIQLLQSAHGLAGVARIDDLEAQIEPKRVLIGRAKGLALTQGGYSQRDRLIPGGDSNQGIKALNLRQEKSADSTKFHKRLEKLYRSLANAKDEARIAAWLTISRHFLGNNLSFETLGALRLALQDSPALADDPSFILLRAAASTLAGRMDDAAKDAFNEKLDESADAALWRTIINAERGRWVQAKETIARGRSIIGTYPLDMQQQFLLSASNTMLQLNDFGETVSLLAEIDPSRTSPDVSNHYDIIRAQLSDASGRPSEALALFDEVMRTGRRPTVALSRLHALRIRQRDGLVTQQQAIDELERLAMYWRGDDIELSALRLLARQQAANGNYREAFEAMKNAVEANPDSEIARSLQDEMNAVFANLFLDGEADNLPPVKAVGLYYDFRELTPVGRQGDELVRNLASRLVEIDLLGKAAELLEHQVEKRLKGSSRAAIAADLAVIYLLDNKPERALKALYHTRQASLPNRLTNRRRLVEARALIASDKADLALELVASVSGDDAARLRAEAYWREENWQRSGEELEALHGPRWSEASELNEQERSDILQAAIAYTLAGDQLSLDRIRSKYSGKMSNSPHAYAFDVVTRPISTKGVEFISVARELADTQTYDGFLREYRKLYLEPRRSIDEAAPAA